MKIPTNQDSENFPTINDTQFLDLFKPNISTIYMDKSHTRKQLIPKFLSSISTSELIIYLDFDAWIRSYLSTSKNNSNILLLKPSQTNLDDSLLTILSCNNPNFSFLILDSIPSFYTLLNQIEPDRAGELLFYYLSSLRNFVYSVNAKMILLNLSIYNTFSKPNNRFTGMKILNQISDNIIYANSVNTNTQIYVYDDELSIKKSIKLEN